MNKRIVALDVGERRIGIAVSDPLGYTAQPVETYTRVGYGPDVRHIAAIAAQYDTREILCGLPLNMNGTHGFQADKVREFAAKLEEAGFTVSYQDERMTTMVAEGALLEADMRRKDRKKKVDMVAAVVILESYLDAQRAIAQREDNAGTQEEEEDADAPEDELLEMVDEDGNAIRFLMSARIPYEGEEYVLLTCVADTGDIAKDESFIMRSATDAEGNPCYQSLDDEALIAAVYEAYLKQDE